MNKTLFLAKVLLGYVSLAVAFSAEATILSFNYTGQIISNPDGIVSVGTGFSGSFSYDDGLVGSSNSNGTLYSPVNFSLSIDGTDINFSGLVNVDDNSTFTLPGNDVLQIGSAGIAPSPDLNGTLLQGITIDLVDSTQTTLSGEGLPLNINLVDWTSKLLVIRSTESLNLTFGSIDSLVSAVPVPAAVWLFGSGLLGLAGMARRKQATTN